jgi:hypothetical protein
MRCYTRLTFAEREEISRHLAAGASGLAIVWDASCFENGFLLALHWD